MLLSKCLRRIKYRAGIRYILIPLRMYGRVMPRWPSWLGRQTHRVKFEEALMLPEKSGGHGFGSRPGHVSTALNAFGI